MIRQTMTRRSALLGAVLALMVAVPAAAQVGVLDQPYRNDPFQPLLRGGWSFTHYLSLGAENNTLGVGDMVALGYLVDDLKPTDLFLVAGLVPAGEGVRLGSQDRTAITITFPVGDYVTLGITGGGRMLASGQVPDNVAALVRDGVVGDEITVDLTEMGGQAFGYAEVGGSGVVDIPLLPTPFGLLRIHAGAGARFVRSLSHVRFGFAGDTGEQTSTVTLSRIGVSTALNLATPIGEEIMADGGTGMAYDLMAGASLGQFAQLRLSVTDIGSAEVMVGQREVRTITMDEVSFLDLGDSTQVETLTDTVMAETRSVSLPTTFRVDASVRPIPMVGVGLRLAVPTDKDAPVLEPLVQAGVELRLADALPLRAGITGGGDFGVGFFGGFGIDTGGFGFDLELASAGGPALADIRGVSFRSALAIRF